MATKMDGKRILVIGSGLSGVGAVRLLHQVGAVPVLLDENEQMTPEKIEQRLAGEDRGCTEILLQKLVTVDLEGGAYSAVVPSPGVPLDTPAFDRIRAAKIPVWSEIELAFRFAKGKLIAITGTNGKTTTTTLVGEIVKAAYGQNATHVVGNIGYSYAEAALKTDADSVTVAEISSFQLEAVEEFHADVSAILNITPDHLNRHHTMENYAACKERVTNGQDAGQVCVLNYDNAYTREFGEKRCPARVLWFSSREELKDGIWLDGEQIVKSVQGEKTALMSVRDMHLVGRCNAENVMAAIGIALSMGIPLHTILTVVREFRAVEHRIEYVATKNGVDYYNDSKATNPDAAIQGIEAMERPTILLGGGYDKGNTYDEWIEAFGGRVKLLVLIGETADKIAACAKAHDFTDIVIAGSGEEALKLCKDSAKPGDAVLLSPACASWDMFPNYEARGRWFKDFVNELSETTE
ncbi:MAG: UDP-N-acetylmuramoyl-L-alanine--D-glutamate ligase [Lachnospiraceae bacterium]|nr:UDP-N-acetylmuramoyl-L-alanine--D-glutamate ligase [Lachnospiraceae bacterium]